MIWLRRSAGAAALGIVLATACGVLQADASGSTGGAAAPFCSEPTISAGEGRPAVDVRLGTDRKVVAAGRALRIRIEDFGARDLAYDLSYDLARRSQGSWVRVPHGPVFAPRFHLRAGTASKCQSIPIPRKAIVGQYRITKRVRPAGMRKEVVVRAMFRVRP